MLVQNVALFPVEALCLHPGGPVQPDVRRHILVKLVTSEGVTGWGEITGGLDASPTGDGLATLQVRLSRLLENRDAANILLAHEVLATDLGTSLGSNRIRAGIDLALYDILGKTLGVPISALLGGVYTREVPVAYPIPAHRNADQVSDSLAYMEHMLARGFEHVRFYIGLNLEADTACLEAMREKFGDRVKIKTLDCNCHMGWRESQSAIERFREFRFDYVESPARRGDTEGLAKVRQALDIPVSEHAYTLADAMRLVAGNAVDILNITAGSAGGIYEARKIAAVAEAAGISCVLGAAHEMSLGTSAQAHLGSTLTNLNYRSDAIGPVIYERDVASTPLEYSDGSLIVPSGPGSGVEIDEDALGAMASF